MKSVRYVSGIENVLPSLNLQPLSSISADRDVLGDMHQPFLEVFRQAIVFVELSKITRKIGNPVRFKVTLNLVG